MAVEPPLRVEHREELVWLLAQACELEHGLMCEYLFAQFTLKRTQQEGLSVQQLAKVAAWERVIVDVTKQEMLPHRVAAWRILTERLEQRAVRAVRADRLSGTAGLAQLGELAIDLHGMARDIESACPVARERRKVP